MTVTTQTGKAAREALESGSAVINASGQVRDVLYTQSTVVSQMTSAVRETLRATNAMSVLPPTPVPSPADPAALPGLPPTPVYYSREQYLDTFLDLLPTGRLWDKEPGSNLYAAIASLIPSVVQLSDRAAELLIDGYPPTTQELLSDWEASLSLPDPCLGVTPSITARRNQVVARFIGQSALSVDFYVAYAATLGYAITITEYSPFYGDLGGADQPLAGEDAAYTWNVTSTTASGWLFKADADTADMPLGGFDNNVLACELQRLAPAHTSVYFTLPSA